MPLRAQHVVINEVLASNSRSNYDGDFGSYSDWIELYNPTGNAVDLEGWYLSDDPADPEKWQIPGSTVIPANGYVLFWADDGDLRPGQLAWTEFTIPVQIIGIPPEFQDQQRAGRSSFVRSTGDESGQHPFNKPAARLLFRQKGGRILVLPGRTYTSCPEQHIYFG
jgi:hypothetical protein